MSKPVYQFFRNKMTSAWWALTPQQREEMMQKIYESALAAGAKAVVLASTSWSSERWESFGVVEYPDAQAVMKNAQVTEDMGWFGYSHGEVVLGTSDDPFMQLPLLEQGGDGKIYKAFLIRRYTNSGRDLTPEQVQEKMAASRREMERLGGKVVISCGSGWANEGIIAFGVEQFPSLEAVQEYYDCLNELDWFRYMESETMLGVRTM
jgi:hypothetical protein